MKQHNVEPLPLIQRIIPATVLAFITGLVYYQSLSYDFQFDDIANITKHFQIRHNTFSKLFFSGTRWISYWINSLHYQYGQFDPLSYRIGNVFIHTMNGLLIFSIFLILLRRQPDKTFFKRNAMALSFITALLFLIHPVQTQTVSYVIQGQLEGLAALFTLCMTLLFLIRSYTTNEILRWGVTVFFFALSALITGTKEIAIVSPFLIMLVDWFFVARGSWNSFKRRLWLHGANSVIVIGCYIYLMKIDFFIELFSLKMEMGNNLGNIITDSPKSKIKPFTFFISQFKVILHYLWMFIWPLNISVEYDWILCKSIISPDCLFPFLLLASIGYIIYKLLLRDATNMIAFAAIWFAIVMAPRSTIMPSPELLVDYKTYLASFAWLFILSAGILKLYEWLQKQIPSFRRYCQEYRLQYALLFCCALLISLGTITRNKIWSSGVDFWGNIVANAPGKARAHNNYGVELSQKLGRFAESIQFFTHAIDMDPEYRDPYNNLAVAYAATHQIDRAIDTLQKSLQINPYYPEAYNNMASFMIEKKDHEMAVRALRNAIHLRPHYGKAHFNMGRALMELDEPEKAWESFRRACMEADLDNEAGFFGFARASLMVKKYDDAQFAFKKVLEYNPNNYEAAFSLANVYYQSGSYTQAAQAYTALLQKNPDDVRLWHNLAESHFSAGNALEALKMFERVKQTPHAHPNTYMRIAACYEQLGNPRMAQSSLKQLLQQPIPKDAKQQVQTALSKINQQYRLS